jgi:enamine deaminase RidA (YjgF/YER057c/UK114 family)
MSSRVQMVECTGLAAPLGLYSHVSRVAARKELFARLYPEGRYPPNTLLVISRLVEPEFLIEIEAIAAV